MLSHQDSAVDASKQTLFLLSVASFFDGYDTLALAQLLPTLEAQMGLSHASLGALAGFVNIGAMAAYFLVRAADRHGRRSMLTITILGYTVFTVLTGLAPNVWVYGILQLCARTFLVAECSISIVYAAEEFPAAQRSTLIGMLDVAFALGSVACALLVPVLVSTRLGWRGVYFVGIIPLLLLARMRRALPETRRFTQLKNEPRATLPSGIWRSPFRGRMLQLALIWALTYACTGPVLTFWKQAALSERGMTETHAGVVVSIAVGLSIPASLTVAKLIDVLGRRYGALIAYGLLVTGTLGSYCLHTSSQLVASLTCGIVGITGVTVVLASYNTELFPTDLRGEAFAYANHLIGRSALIMSPLVTGRLAQNFGWTQTICFSVLLPLLALALILLLLPETAGRELEETSVSEVHSV